jgi:hypothetical protein
MLLRVKRTDMLVPGKTLRVPKGLVGGATVKC